MRTELRMQNPTAPDHIGAMVDCRFEGQQAFREAFVETIRRGARDGWKQAIFCDMDFEDWPLGDRTTAALLDAWAQRGARFTLLARRYDGVVRQHARFVAWRKRWSHRVDCWQVPTAAAAALPSACWTSHELLHRIDPVHSVCIATAQVARRVAMKETLTGLVRRSTVGFVATTLGL